VAIVAGVKAGFLKRAGLEEGVETVPGGHDAFFAAAIQFVLSSAGPGGGAALFQIGQQFF
jgi:hypothetical protein